MKQKIDYNLELRKYWKQAQDAERDGDIEAADTALDYCILVLAHATEKGWDRILDTTVDIFKTRVWMKVEALGLLPD